MLTRESVASTICARSRKSLEAQETRSNQNQKAKARRLVVGEQSIAPPPSWAKGNRQEEASRVLLTTVRECPINTFCIAVLDAWTPHDSLLLAEDLQEEV
jgi:hypothetical protein